MFTKQHYEAIAEVLHDVMPNALDTNQAAQKSRWIVIRDALAYRFRKDNPRFDIDRFFRAAEGR